MNPLDTLGCQVVKCSNHASDRPYAALGPWGVQALYFNANESGDTDPLFLVDGAAILRDAKKNGYLPCIYFIVPRQDVGGRQFADTCSARVTELGGATRVEVVLFDNEKVPLVFQREFIDRWDQLRPWRPTLYSVEPYQDRSQNDYYRMLRRNGSGRRVRKITHQDYFGGMQPQPPNQVAEYLRRDGLTDDNLCPTIDPAQPANIIGQALGCNQRGAVLFHSGRTGH